MTAADLGYMPILKGRMGELRALRELGIAHKDNLTPLIEIPLLTSDIETEDPTATGVIANIGKFAADLRKNVSGDRRFIFDATQAPLGAAGEMTPTVEVLLDLLEHGVDATPTVRPSDEVGHLDVLRQALDDWNHNSLCIRVAGEDLDPDDQSLADSLDSLITRLGRTPSKVDMLIDFGAVADDAAASLAARIARLVLSELPYIAEWRTLTLASGGFPPDLNGVQPEVLTDLARHDAAMWRSVSSRVRDRIPGFADYGVGYPVQALGGGFAPAPQLRYTFGDAWLIYKGRKRDRRGSKQFFDVCRRLVDAGAVDPNLSWGDAYTADAALGEVGGRGTGNAMIWRAIGTSHHLSYVSTRLAKTGAP